MSVPSSHVYVRHLAAVDSTDDGPRVLRLPDPTVPWWPPQALQPAWLSEHLDEFDVFHVHFGFDAVSPQELQRLVELLREGGKPLVYTVHDLRNPHHESPAAHDAHLDVLIPAADALVTLTAGAAAEIRARWGREAVVLPHPHVVDLDLLGGGGSGTPRKPGESVVGVHFKSLRACMLGAPMVHALVRSVARLPSARLRIDAHRDVAERTGRRCDVELMDALDAAADAGAEVHVHDYFSDDGLWRYLSSLDVSVLPYRFGTHSGWLEACRDLGTAVLAPSCGYYADQGPCHVFQLDEAGVDEVSLEHALRRAHSAGRPSPASKEWRLRQRNELAERHRGLYANVLEIRR